MRKYYLGIDIGGTRIKTVVLNDLGKTIEQIEEPTNDGNTEKELWKKKIIRTILDISARYVQNDPEVMKFGISAPGLVDLKNTMTLHMPLRLQGIELFDWSVALQRKVSVINDGHAACLAEYESFYRPKGISHFLMLTLGTGVGGGIIINGQLYQGNLQRAGHVGHMSLDSKGANTMTNMPGSLEHAIGNFSVSERTNGKYSSTQELVTAYENGNSQAKNYWLESVRKLAVGLASLTNILSPEYIVLGGGIAIGAGNSLFTPLREYMADCEWRPNGHSVKIRQAKLGSFAGAIGAAQFAKKNT